MEGQIAFAVCRGFATAEQALSFALWGLRGGRGLPGAYGIAHGIGESELCDQATAGTE